jgi:hypothetical protein
MVALGTMMDKLAIPIMPKGGSVAQPINAIVQEHFSIAFKHLRKCFLV